MTAIQRFLSCTAIIMLSFDYCICEAQFDIFPGFENYNTDTEKDPELHSTPTDATTSIATTMYLEKSNVSQQHPNASQTVEFSCPEEEQPSNIGPYEVPTQRDLVKQMKTKLLRLFNSYHKQALFFLKDIKEATKATSEIASKCPGNSRETYRKCVKHVSHQCQLITKMMVTSLEYKRHDVSAVTDGSICNMTTMKADPVELIKVLAMEKASLEFALPGFLRLLSACSVYCNSSQTEFTLKPTRHMTDQDLVIKHFLTRKNYIQLIRGTQ